MKQALITLTNFKHLNGQETQKKKREEMIQQESLYVGLERYVGLETREQLEWSHVCMWGWQMSEKLGTAARESELICFQKVSGFSVVLPFPLSTSLALFISFSHPHRAKLANHGILSSLLLFFSKVLLMIFSNLILFLSLSCLSKHFVENFTSYKK